MKMHTALTLGLALFSTCALAADPHLGRNLAATCANCHGTAGRAVPGLDVKPLAGMDKKIILQRLNEFKSGAKPATIMHQIAKGYSEEQLDLIAAWFAAQK